MAKVDREKLTQREKDKEDDFYLKPVTIKDMQCKNCKFALREPNQVSYCKIFPAGKPGEVMYGGYCPRFEKRDKTP